MRNEPKVIFVPIAGGAEPREAKLGALERRAARADHGRGQSSSIIINHHHYYDNPDQVEDSENRAKLKLERAVEEVKKLLTVVSCLRPNIQKKTGESESCWFDQKKIQP